MIYRMRAQCKRNRPLLWLLSGLLLLSQTMVAGHFHHDHEKTTVGFSSDFTPASVQLLLARDMQADLHNHSDEPVPEDYTCELCLHAYTVWSVQPAYTQPDPQQEGIVILAAFPEPSSQSVYRDSQPRASPSLMPAV